MKIKKFNESNEILYKEIDFEDVMEMDEVEKLSNRESEQIISIFPKENIVSTQYGHLNTWVEIYYEVKSNLGSYKSDVVVRVQSLGDSWYIVTIEKLSPNYRIEERIKWFKCDDIVGIKQLLTDRRII